MSYVIEVENLTYIYPNGIKALDNISLKVKEGDCVAIIGPNGSGKTTLLLNIVGILKGNGNIKVCGYDPRRDFNKVRKLIGFVFQNPEDQLFTLTVYDEISFTLKSLKIPDQEIRSRIQEVLKFLKLEGYESRSIYSLSFGEMKKVALATALVLKPKILLLDEPTLALDPWMKFEIIEIMKKLNREYGITIVFTTHDVDLVPYIANYVYVMYQGKIIKEGKPNEVLTDKKLLESIGLKIPIITEFFIRLKEFGFKINEIPITIEQALELMLNILKHKKPI